MGGARWSPATTGMRLPQKTQLQRKGRTRSRKDKEGGVPILSALSRSGSVSPALYPRSLSVVGETLMHLKKFFYWTK